jgi:antitoxin component YwqK of YwqJK toxin-antitoxin module/tetratricopeptide (TPR) repeat protein
MPRSLRRRAILLAATSCISFPLFASPAADTLPDSRTTIMRGVQLHEEGKYKEAIALYRSVPEGDTNYVYALNESVVSALADSAYADARKWALEGLALPNRPSFRSFLLMLGHACDYMGDQKGALHYYDTLLVMNPYDHQPWYEKGAMYVRQEKYDEAISSFRRSIMLNPNHFRSHYTLGLALLRQGRLAEAYLALSFSLFATNNKSEANSSMSLLALIQQQTDEVVKAWQERDPAHSDPAFDEADAILNAKLAMSKEYKYESVLSGDMTANTLHVILEKVKYDPADTGLVMQYYVPFYRYAYENGNFDPMLLLMYMGYEIESVEKLAKKKSGDITDFRKFLSGYIDKIAATQVLNYNKRKTAPEQYALISAEEIFIVGGLDSRDPVRFKPGPIVIYNEGNYAGKGRANAKGSKEGEWIFYHPNGNVRSRETYKDGEITGEAFYYRMNGTPSSSSKYDKDGKLIEKREYTYSGVLDNITTDAGDHAVLTSYHPNGTVEYQVNMRDGAITDPLLKPVYPDGRLAKDIRLANGKRNGVTREYYSNGKLSEETEYKNDERDGKSTTYYKSGNVHYKAGYSDDKLEGPYEEYNEDGKLIERGEYHNGRKTGKMESLTPDGRVYGTITYRKDLPVAYQYTDDAGKVLSGAEKNGQLDRLVAYYANGNKMSELKLRDGKANGVAKYYYLTGSLRKEVSFVDDKAEGKATEYFSGGVKRSESNFRDDKEVGPYVSYLRTGVKRLAGHVENGNRCGLWLDYYPDGTLEEEDFYVNGKLNGPEKHYRANGSLHYTRLYDKNMLIGLIEYDTLGHELRRSYFPAGNGAYTEHSENGKPKFVATLRNGLFDGPYKLYYASGAVSQSGFFRNGQDDSLVIGYHPNGIRSLTGQERNGEREGKWIFYNAAGQPDREINYLDGEQHGPEKVWVAGILHSEYNYRHGEQDGRTIFYGDSNKVAAVLFYKDGLLLGYTYPGQDGKELPMIALKNGTGRVQTTYPNGGKAADLSFVEGLFEGDATRWYSNGQQAMEQHYKQGADAEGYFRRWSPSGQKLYEALYHDDIMSGTELTWDAQGRLINSVERTVSGEYHGLSVFVDPASGKKATLQYYYGAMAD